MAATRVQCTEPSTSHCVGCQANLCVEHILLGQQLITARQLVAVIVKTLLRAPRMLGEPLFKELDQVEYCTECPTVLAGRRQAEQLKFLGGLILMLMSVVSLVAFV